MRSRRVIGQFEQNDPHLVESDTSFSFAQTFYHLYSLGWFIVIYHRTLTPARLLGLWFEIGLRNKLKNTIDFTKMLTNTSERL